MFPNPLHDWIFNFFSGILDKYYDLEISEHPDYIFYTAHCDDYHLYDCVRISFAAENVTADFNVCDYAVGFDHIYFGDRYLRFPLYLLYREALTVAMMKHMYVKESLLRDKNRFCNFVVSNGRSDEKRTIFFDLLSKYKKVDSGGRYKNNLGTTVKDKFSFQQLYKFSICFENSSTPGYLTEKLIQASAARTLPIYWGDYNASRLLGDNGSGLNFKAFINVHEYNSLDEVVKVVERIDKDDQLYMSMLREPLFLDNDHEMIYRDKLGMFLGNIFEQPIAMAYRRGFGQVRYGIEQRKKKCYELRKTSNISKELVKRIAGKIGLVNNSQ